MEESEKDLVRQMPRMLHTLAWLYVAISNNLVSRFGAEGGKSTRRWLRQVAKWRGTELRKAHMALGLPVNMESIMRYWDNASTHLLMDEWNKVGKFTPYDVEVPVKKCPYADVWADHDYWLWGHVYCDEMHQHVLEAYHPDSVVVMPRNLMKRDKSCDFRWVMPPDAAKEVEAPDPYPGQDVLADWQDDTPEISAVCSLRRTTRLLAIQIHYLFPELEKTFGISGAGCYRSILEDFFRLRGEALAREAEEHNWGNDLESFFSNFDVPYSDVWELKRQSKNNFEIEVRYCPLKQTWDYFGDSPGAVYFCENQYSMVAKTFDGGIRAKTQKCMTRGDSVCVITFEKI